VDEVEKETARARLFIQAMNRMRVTTAAVGSLDFGLGVGKFRELMQEMQYPVLAGNIIDDSTGKPLFKESMIVNANGYRIGLVGVTSRKFEYRQKTLPHEGLTINDPAACVKKAVASIKGQCDFIMLLANLTLDELDETAKSAGGVSFILAGHNVRMFSRNVDEKEGIPVLQLPTRGREVGVMTIVPNGKDWKFRNRSEGEQMKERIENYQSALRDFDSKAGGRDIEEFYKNEPAKIAQYKKLQERMAEEKKRLAGLASEGSYFEFKTVPLDNNIDDDMQVKGWVTKFSDTYEPNQEIEP
jgi:2',3'-cyclic-nucleotide 2'-phosphodiesterase (5'-nucleotidase family)